MKIRTDFVTNSSSSSFVTVHVDDEDLAKDLGYSDLQEMNDAVKSAIHHWYDIYEFQPPVSDMTSLEGLFTLLSLNDPDIKAYMESVIEKIEEEEDDETWMDFLFSHELQEKLRKQFKENHTSLFEKLNKNEGDINGLTFDLGYHDDGGYGPFVYVRINNGKRLTIVTEETYDEDAYRGEKINGVEFLLLETPKDYSAYDAIVEYIQSNGGTVTTELTDATKYAVYPVKKGRRWKAIQEEQDIIKSVRAECVPVLSEKAFAYRWLNAPIEGDFDDMVYGLRDWGEYIQWFEMFGFGKATVEYWKNGKWRK